MRVGRDRLLDEIEELYRARFPYFVQVARAIVGDRERAVDAVQDGFADAIRGRAGFRGDGALEAWVWRAVVNAARKKRAPIRVAVHPHHAAFVLLNHLSGATGTRSAKINHS